MNEAHDFLLTLSRLNITDGVYQNHYLLADSTCGRLYFHLMDYYKQKRIITNDDDNKDHH